MEEIALALFQVGEPGGELRTGRDDGLHGLGEQVGEDVKEIAGTQSVEVL